MLLAPAANLFCHCEAIELSRDEVLGFLEPYEPAHGRVFDDEDWSVRQFLTADNQIGSQCELSSGEHALAEKRPTEPPEHKWPCWVQLARLWVVVSAALITGLAFIALQPIALITGLAFIAE